MKRSLYAGLAVVLVFPMVCAGAAFADGIDAWVRAKVKEAASMPTGPADAKLSAKAPTAASLLSSFKDVSVSSPSAPVALLNEPAHQVWETRAGGERFLVHVRPDDVRPYLRLITGLPKVEGADFTAAKALVIEKVLGGDTSKSEISASRVLVSSSETTLRSGKDEVTAPWDTCWVFFIDDAPRANWGHDCRYVFVATDLSAVAVQYARMPMEIQGKVGGNALSFEVISPYVPAKAEVPAAGEETGASAGAPLNFAGDASRCYAVIISGGANQLNNHIRYWGDAAFVYSTLTLKYGYAKDHIYLLVSDGTNPAVDRSNGTNSPTDLDGDLVVDTNYSAIYTNVQTVFAELASILTAGDQLFVFTTDHGTQESGWAAYINLWNWAELHDHQLKDMTIGLPCPVMFAMEQCYSGGFLDDLNQSNRCIATAAIYYRSSYDGDTSPTYDHWAYYWTAAMRGYKPGAQPWLDGAAVNADTDGDGRVSFKEASDYAFANKYVGPGDYYDTPQYQSVPPALGASLFLNQIPTPTPTPTPTPLPAQINLNGSTFGPGAPFNATFVLNRSIEQPFTVFSVIIMPGGSMLNTMTLGPNIGPVASNVPRLDVPFQYPLFSLNLPADAPIGAYEILVAFFDPSRPITGRGDAFLEAAAPFTIQ